jgi:hypothetical protein
MATKREIRAWLRQALKGVEATWNESNLVLENLAVLHEKLLRLLTESGQFNSSGMQALMRELDYILLQHAGHIGELAQAAQRRAWARGVEQFDETMSLFELSYVRGLTGMESDLARQFFTIDRISGVTAEMMTAIRAQVLAGVFLEKTPFEVMAVITNVIGIRDLRGYRQIGTTGISAKAERILRTELMTVQNAGGWQRRQDAVKRYPDLEEVWMATGDGRTRDDHLTAHGQRKPVKGYFVVGGEKARFPGDPSLSAAQRVNCRCAAAPFRAEWGSVEDILEPLTRAIQAEKGKRQATGSTDK